MCLLCISFFRMKEQFWPHLQRSPALVDFLSFKASVWICHQKLWPLCLLVWFGLETASLVCVCVCVFRRRHWKRPKSQGWKRGRRRRWRSGSEVENWATGARKVPRRTQGLRALSSYSVCCLASLRWKFVKILFLKQCTQGCLHSASLIFSWTRMSATELFQSPLSVSGTNCHVTSALSLQVFWQSSEDWSYQPFLYQLSVVLVRWLVSLSDTLISFATYLHAVSLGQCRSVSRAASIIH